MARITVLGGTGYAGAAIAAEAARRGHEVTAVSRTQPEAPAEGVDYITGSVLDDAVLDTVLAGRDVVISALSPRGDMAGKVEGVLKQLAGRLAGTPTRLAHIGGASSLLVEAGGPRLWDVTKDHVPDEVRPTVARMAEVAEEMVSKVSQIITGRDVQAAIALGRADEEMDRLRRTSFTELLADDWSHGVEAAVDVALLGRYYERIADHAVSVANRVVFVVTGEHPRSVTA